MSVGLALSLVLVSPWLSGAPVAPERPASPLSLPDLELGASPVGYLPAPPVPLPPISSCAPSAAGPGQRGLPLGFACDPRLDLRYREAIVRSVVGIQRVFLPLPPWSWAEEH